MVALAAAEYSRYREAFYAYSLDSLLVQEGAQLFATVPVHNLTFDGYVDEILEAADTFPPFIYIPIPFDKFGWFYPVIYFLQFSCFTGV